jgi:replicative DNA helicase
MNENSDKLKPQAIEFENSLLGIFMSYPKSLDRVIHFLLPDMFYKDENKVIFQAIISLYKKSAPIDILTVSNELKKTEQLEVCGGMYYVSTLPNKIADDSKTMYYTLILFQNYLKREIIRISIITQQEGYDNAIDAFAVIEKLKTELDTLDGLIGKVNNKSKNAVKNAMKGIKDRVKGLILAFLKTGDDKFDETFALEPRTITVLAGQKGHLKSKFVLHLAEMLDKNNPDMAFYWLSMEESAEKIIRGKISLRTGISEKRLLSKTENKLTEEELELVEKASDEIEKQTVIYIDKKTSMSNILSGFRLFIKENPNKVHVLIIDNLGLITNDDFRGNSVEIDDNVAGKFVEIRDQTNAIIIIIHHLTKAHLSMFNAADGYRPREEHVRGSARILDYSDNTILVNKPGKFSDLVRDEITKGIEGKFNYEKEDSISDSDNLLNAFLSINDQMDKQHKDHSTEAYQGSLHSIINFVFKEPRLKTYFKGIIDANEASDIILFRYLHYYNGITAINSRSEARFHKQINDPLTFLSKEHFKIEPKINKETREWYLYGNDIDVLRSKIKKLFIIDGTKIRSGSHDDEDTIIRYLADGSNNRFIQITEKMTNEWRRQ